MTSSELAIAVRLLAMEFKAENVDSVERLAIERSVIPARRVARQKPNRITDQPMHARAALPQKDPQPSFLMCPPRHFAVTYSINPWMDPQAWADGGAALSTKAERQWAKLHRALHDAGAVIQTVEPIPGLPDLVFTANAAVVLDRKVVLSRFRHDERRGEEPIFAASFETLGARGLIDEIFRLPAGIVLEGAGDCIWDSRRKLFWLGCGFRSDAAAARFIERKFSVPCLIVPLANASFYHLDTAFCALPCGSIVYYPEAFTSEALATIHARALPEERVVLEEADAAHFAANAICINRKIVLSSCSDSLRRRLQELGYAIIETPLRAFMRSGGSACCLTLRLDHCSMADARTETAAGVKDPDRPNEQTSRRTTL
jgi:N-dimethylarginine dimethylaminohydrolase